MRVLNMEIIMCGCGCQATQLRAVDGEDRVVLAEVSTEMYQKSKEVEEAFKALAGAIGDTLIKQAGAKPLRMHVQRSELN
jgi:hypothetical protein